MSRLFKNKESNDSKDAKEDPKIKKITYEEKDRYNNNSRRKQQLAFAIRR